MKQTATAILFEILFNIFRLIPRVLHEPIVRAWGALYSCLPHKQRKGLRYNLSRLLGVSGDELDRLTWETFKNFSSTLHDFFFPEGVHLDVPDRAKLEKTRREHGGVIVLTFHMGHWELGARTMREWGWPVSAVHQPYHNKRFKKMVESRRAPGVSFISVGHDAAKGIRAALKRGDMVAILGDHPFGEEGSMVNILGHDVLWPKGPVLLAVKEKAPIHIAVVVRTASRRYVGIVSDALIPKSKSRAEVDRLIKEVGHKFGMLLTQFPTQWYRFAPMDFLEDDND
jgi:lauroyl/myristoyl acyltransferase